MNDGHLDGISAADLKKINRKEILKCIPKECLKKSLFWSLFFGIRDFVFGFTVYYFFSKFNQTEFYLNFWFPVRIVFYFLYCFIAGFFMWCMFVVGHDCGHGSFSKSQLINDICGHIFHGCIFVPFWPWAISHNRHHVNHNHKDKDYSNPWHSVDHPTTHSYDNWWPIVPVVAWQLYLIGGWSDGTHFYPTEHRLYKNACIIEKMRAMFSSLICFLWVYIFYQFFHQSWSLVAYFYVGPLFGFGWWLFTVTYFQHHGEHSIVYDNTTWNYEFAAFQTIDRTFGKTIDYLHHRITDCHVLHHILFTKIPHYHLKKANQAFIEYLNKNNLEHLYQFEETQTFMYRIFTDFGTHRFTYIYYVNEENARNSEKENLFALNKNVDESQRKNQIQTVYDEIEHEFELD